MRLFNTLSGQKEEFTTPDGEVKMYVCGVTPYAPAHVGHAMSYVIFDVIRRYVEYRGFKVQHVQNFTDIDDKIIQSARRQGISIQELADNYLEEYFLDMDALNIRRAHHYPRATQEIDKMVEMIAGLADKGYAYAVDGDVYFRVRKATGYGQLSRRSLDGLVAGARIEPEDQKEYSMDFALWKKAKPGEPNWDSPWGKGRPGWHIECSAMSLNYLGPTVDIHGGGQDLVFPHHENEIVQAEAYTGISPFARFWVHNGLLRMGEDKMSKSLGNFVTVKEVLGRYEPDALRLFFLSSHYRNPLTFNEEAVASQERAAERLRNALKDFGTEGQPPLDPASFKVRFLGAMDDDLNTPQALAVLFDLAHQINRSQEEGVKVKESQNTLRELAGVLGLTLKEGSVIRRAALEPFIELLVEIRDELRGAKQYALSDKVRERLRELGVVLEDTPRGTEWKYRPG